MEPSKLTLQSAARIAKEQQQTLEPILLTQELEKRKWALAIHDGITQSLDNIYYHLQAYKKLVARDTQEAQQDLNKIEEFVLQAIAECKGMTDDYRPSIPDDIELVPAIEKYLNSMRKIVIRELEESASIKRILAENLSDMIANAAKIVLSVYKAGGKVFLIGNGGSAADAQHIAAELVGRFKLERMSLPAIALTTDTSTLTALANDYGYDRVFSRQLEALANDKDALIAITTSGTSPNILKAVEMAHSKGVIVIGLTGAKGSKLKDRADLTIVVPSDNTARIQEAHITIGHIICHLVEQGLFSESRAVFLDRDGVITQESPHYAYKSG